LLSGRCGAKLRELPRCLSHPVVDCAVRLAVPNHPQCGMRRHGFSTVAGLPLCIFLNSAVLQAKSNRNPTTSWQVLEEIKLRQLHLQQNELFEEGTRRVIEARCQMPMHRSIMEA